VKILSFHLQNSLSVLINASTGFHNRIIGLLQNELSNTKCSVICVKNQHIHGCDLFLLQVCEGSYDEVV